MIRKIYTTLSLFLISNALLSQLTSGSYYAAFEETGNCFTEFGDVGFEFPKFSGLYLIYRHNLWIGAKDGSGNLVLSADAYNSAGADFDAGPIPAGLNTKWHITKAEIDAFKLAFGTASFNINDYPQLRDWPCHGDTSIGQSWLLAPFIDMDNDGLYDPAADGDYPNIRGDESVYLIFNDAGIYHDQTGGLGLGLEVHVLASAFSCPASGFNNVCLLNTTIYNRSNVSYDSLRLGAWLDMDAGYFMDDYIGCDSARRMFFTYNSDAVDDGASGYGTSPAAVGYVFLDQYMTSFIYYENDATPRGAPVTKEDYWHLMNGRWKNGINLVNNGSSGHPIHGSGAVTHFCYPGNGGWCTPKSGWSEVSAAMIPGDRRGIGAIGPFSLAADSMLSFNSAVIAARSSTSPPFGSVCSLMSLADVVSDAFYLNATPCGDVIIGVPEQSTAPVVQIYPNPAAGFVVVSGITHASDDLLIQALDGSTVFTFPLTPGKETQSFRLPVLADGIYMIHGRIQGQVFSERLLIRN